LAEGVGGFGGPCVAYDESVLAFANYAGLAEIAAGGGWVSAKGSDVGSGFRAGDLRFSGGVSAGGDCFIDEGAGEVAGRVDGVGGDDDECGIGDGTGRIYRGGEGEVASDGVGGGGGVGGE
jgi:hypothetical protein